MNINQSKGLYTQTSFLLFMLRIAIMFTSPDAIESVVLESNEDYDITDFYGLVEHLKNRMTFVRVIERA